MNASNNPAPQQDPLIPVNVRALDTEGNIGWEHNPLAPAKASRFAFSLQELNGKKLVIAPEGVTNNVKVNLRDLHFVVTPVVGDNYKFTVTAIYDGPPAQRSNGAELIVRYPATPAPALDLAAEVEKINTELNNLENELNSIPPNAFVNDERIVKYRESLGLLIEKIKSLPVPEVDRLRLLNQANGIAALIIGWGAYCSSEAAKAKNLMNNVSQSLANKLGVKPGEPGEEFVGEFRQINGSLEGSKRLLTIVVVANLLKKAEALAAKVSARVAAMNAKGEQGPKPTPPKDEPKPAPTPPKEEKPATGAKGETVPKTEEERSGGTKLEGQEEPVWWKRNWRLLAIAVLGLIIITVLVGINHGWFKTSPKQAQKVKPTTSDTGTNGVINTNAVVGLMNTSSAATNETVIGAEMLAALQSEKAALRSHLDEAVTLAKESMARERALRQKLTELENSVHAAAAAGNTVQDRPPIAPLIADTVTRKARTDATAPAVSFTGSNWTNVANGNRGNLNIGGTQIINNYGIQQSPDARKPGYPPGWRPSKVIYGPGDIPVDTEIEIELGAGQVIEVRTPDSSYQLQWTSGTGFQWMAGDNNGLSLNNSANPQVGNGGWRTLFRAGEKDVTIEMRLQKTR